MVLNRFASSNPVHRQVKLEGATRAGNMGRARWAGPNWPDILEGRTMKLATRIKFGPIGPARIGPAAHRVRAGPARLARIFFKNFFIINFKK